ncbi:hypothetical protein T459_00533 [Capsicum annuum]|uniref:Uncharacterized protein n=1 Tax=Capsicum annuum TaxID=4072 RepID=A0A2G3AEI9_CAPAN|nr:hypothetical protein T459_00533 [Capsicum annuum]
MPEGIYWLSGPLDCTSEPGRGGGQYKSTGGIPYNCNSTARWNPPMVLGGQASNPSSRQDLEMVYPPSSSEHKENAKLQVAKAALKELYYNPYDKMDVESVPLQRKRKNAESIPFQKKKMDVEFDQTKESEGAKQKLNELCQREKWPEPTYRREVTSKRCREFSSLSNDSEFAGIQFQFYIAPCSNSRMKQTAGDGATWN